VVYAPYFPHVLDAWSKRKKDTSAVLFAPSETIGNLKGASLNNSLKKQVLNHLHFKSIFIEGSVRGAESQRCYGLLLSSPQADSENTRF